MGIVEDRKKALEEANKAAKAAKASDSTGITTGKLSPTLLAAANNSLRDLPPSTFADLVITRTMDDLSRTSKDDSIRSETTPSNPIKPIFDERTIQYASKLMALEPDPGTKFLSIDDIESTFMSVCNERGRCFFKNKDNQDRALPTGWVVKVDNKILVYYRGTYTNKEIMSDVNIIPSRIRFGTEEAFVHSGFKKEFLLSEESMNKAIKGLDPTESLPIIFTGHSMGAAIAQIAGLKHAILHPHSDTKVITLGGPRVFGHDAAKLYNETLDFNTLRIKQAGDPICNLPPKGLYTHAGSIKIKASPTEKMKMHMPETYQNIINSINQATLDAVNSTANALKIHNQLIDAKLSAPPPKVVSTQGPVDLYQDPIRGTVVAPIPTEVQLPILKSLAVEFKKDDAGIKDDWIRDPNYPGGHRPPPPRRNTGNESSR